MEIIHGLQVVRQSLVGGMMKNIAIVTGASSGLGREFVRLLIKDRSIDEIWTVARDEEKLNRLKKRFGMRVKTYSVDLSDIEAVKEFGKLISNSNVNISMLINNAGYAKFCSYNDLSVDESVNMIDLNCSAVVAMGLICIPHMKQGSHIINISSQSAFQPLPYFNIYSATKAFVRNYSRALNVELKSKGIVVTAVCPGWLDTAFYDRASIGAKKTITKFYGMQKPSVMAARALKDARENKEMSVYGIHAQIGHIAAKLLPHRLVMNLWLKIQKLQ